MNASRVALGRKTTVFLPIINPPVAISLRTDRMFAIPVAINLRPFAVILRWRRIPSCNDRAHAPPMFAIPDADVCRSLHVPRSGVGSVRTRCAPGAIARGYSPAIRNLPARPALSLISTSVAGAENRWDHGITFSVSTRRPASRPDGANTTRCLPPPAVRSALNTNMRGLVRWYIWPPWTYTGPGCSGVASASQASLRLSALSLR